MVAAMHFKTHDLEYAFCTLHDYNRDPNRIMVHSWNSGTNITEKETNTVLIKPNGKDCSSSGYDAEREYLDLDPTEQKKH